MKRDRKTGSSLNVSKRIESRALVKGIIAGPVAKETARAEETDFQERSDAVV